MSKDTRNVPALRFKGFSDAWEKRKLGELAEFINGRAYKQDELLTSGKYPVLRVGNFYTNDKWYYSDLELPEKYYAEKGDLLYTWSATFGPHIWIGPKVIYHYHIWKVALKNLFEKDFALQFFEADRVRLLNSTNGSTMIHVTKKEMESKGILLPDISEQRNIGELLRKADDLIAATQDKLDHFEEIKKALLKHLFDQSMRFKGYSDPWEKRKLGEIADIRGGGTPSTSKPEYWDGEIDWYAPAEIGTQRYVSGSRRQITNLGLNKSSATMLPANKTILFTSRAGIGNAAILTKSGATNQGFQSIVVKPATDIYFLYSEVPEIKRKAIRLAAGSTFLEISGKSLSKIQIWLPSFKEQSRIGHLFLQIDNLIAATQSKLSSLESLKKALLQGLFI